MKNNKRIILLMDNNAMEIFIKKSFKKYNFNVKVINEYKKKDFEKEIIKYSPDIIICDMDIMPGVGIEFIKHIRSIEDNNDIPIIFLSYSDDERLDKLLDYSGTDYVFKPVDFSELHNRVKIIYKIKEDYKKQFENMKKSYLKAASATLHHEINQPLSVILLSTEILEAKGKNKFTKKDRDNIKRIRFSVEKIEEILYRLTLATDSSSEIGFEKYDESDMIKLPKAILKKTILVIDDNDDIRNVLKDLLKEEGADVLTAKNAKEAKSILTKKYSDIDAVFCDVMLGKDSGLEIFHKVRKLNEKINFVFITAYPVKGELKRIIREFNVPVFRKPFTRRKVLIYLGLKKGKKSKK